MKKMFLLYISMSILFGSISYLSSNNYIIGGIVFLISILYFFLFFMKRFNVYRLSTSRFKSCYQFINSFIISLSIKLTIPAALESTSLTISDELKEEMEGINHLSDVERLNYIKKYFHFHIYELFLNVISLYEDRGGNILDMSTYLINESQNQHEYLIKCESLSTKKWVEFAILWFLSLAIMVILRFALSQFFGLIAKQLIFKITIVAVFMLVLISIEILARKSFDIEVKGWDIKHE